MPAIDNHPDLKLRRDYELARLNTAGHCKDCDKQDVVNKWERLAAQRDNLNQPRTHRRIRP